MDGHGAQRGEKRNVGNMQNAVTWKFKKEMTEHCNSCSVNGFQHMNWIKWTQDVIQRHSMLLAEYNFQHLLQYW
jgi:hypothetical protein